MKSPEVPNQPVGCPALSRQTGHCEEEVIVDCKDDHVRRMHYTFLTNGLHLMTSLIKIFWEIVPVWLQRYYRIA